MIFAPFDAQNISLLKNVKKSICLYRSFLTKREIIDTSEKTVLIRNIDCTQYEQGRLQQGLNDKCVRYRVRMISHKSDII